MDKLQFWKEGHGRVPSARLATKRMVVRTLCLLVLFVLVYHIFTSVELRNSIHDRVTPLIQQDPSKGSTVLTEPSTLVGQPKVTIGKEKATLLMLVRNRELHKALGSMRMVEDRFNRKFHYPWTFMNDKPFTDDFIRFTTGMASGPVEYVVIPKEHWSVPDSLNKTKIQQGMEKLRTEGVIYGGSSSYRHMCRFNSGFFYRQEALKKYDWYWRVEPDIELYCDINYDPFTFMRESGKVYGWVLSMFEFEATIPTLWQHTKDFISKFPQFIAEDNSLGWIVDGANVTKAFAEKKVEGNYNLCHFWSNFEIASLNFYRSEPYQKYFDYLDSQGGFFYERWGDAPVHSLALALMLPRNKIHHFADIGYNHAPASRCPQDDASHVSGRCYCDRSRNYDNDNYSCGPRWFALNGVGIGALLPASLQNNI